ncbi:DUF1573 domain-containing protein [Flavobacterium silvisoli]|uniref:DUF1573 domain-containing protein n=1 Tax=Flavobacterium silvisoli TaxID=2529433 RepID=A0A4Q9Z177_9FLAO|nr:DUF1573 domain-containing protein [Flavobacterium silvisoli]TBX69982.1 DUF1573 domain-containing protein [Flavobacterium silvisoli]
MIRKVSFLAVATLLVFATSCKNEKETTPAAETEMTFETQKHDFGTITQGDKVEYDFKFKNTGKADLLITDAKGSCGCTIPEYPKEPVAPGKDGIIKVSFNSAGKIGENSKSVVLSANVPEGKKILYIQSNIVSKGTN